MVDEWETANGLEVGLDDADEDADADGRTNIEEYNAGTDPQVPDLPLTAIAASLEFGTDTRNGRHVEF